MESNWSWFEGIRHTGTKLEPFEERWVLLGGVLCIWVVDVASLQSSEEISGRIRFS